MTVIHEPHNLGSSPSDPPDLFAPLTDTAYDITVLSAYVQKMLARPFYVEKMKNTNDMTPV